MMGAGGQTRSPQRVDSDPRGASPQGDLKARFLAHLFPAVALQTLPMDGSTRWVELKVFGRNGCVEASPALLPSLSTCLPGLF